MTEENPLPEATKILRKFKRMKKDELYYAAKDIKPPNGYPEIEEQDDVYGYIKTLCDEVRFSPMFEMDFKDHYLLATEPIADILKFLNYIQEDITSLEKLVVKYKGEYKESRGPYIVVTTLDLHKVVESSLLHVLDLPEVLQVIKVKGVDTGNHQQAELKPLDRKETDQIEVLRDIYTHGSILIHKDLPVDELSVLRRLAASGYIKKEGFEYKMLEKGYQALEVEESDQIPKSTSSDSKKNQLQFDWQEVRNAIARNDWDKALEKIESVIGDRSTESDLITSLKAQIADIEKLSIKGVMSFDEERRSKSKITNALLRLVNHLKE